MLLNPRMSIFVVMKRNPLKDYLECLFLKSAGRMLSILPTRCQYLISNSILRPVLQYLIRYRKRTIQQQLLHTLRPEKDKLQAHIDSYYKHLSRLIMEVVTGYYTSQKELKKKMVYKNPEILDEAFANRKDVFMISGHYANWEWGIAVAQQYLSHQVIGVYKPMHNDYMNKFVLSKREKNGSKLIPTSKLLRDVLSTSTVPRIYMLLGDQYPKDQEHQIIEFLDQPTLFQNGIQRIAGKYKIPVVYADIMMVDIGVYSLNLKWLDSNADKITLQYAAALELSIRRDPNLWLWSHRRWRD